MNAAHANEYRSNLGSDFTLADAYDEAYLDDEPEPRDSRRDEEAAPLAAARRPTGQRVGAFLI